MMQLDKFYTKDSIAKRCLKHIDLSNYDYVIEPSAGAGAFTRWIDHPKLIAMDIEPESGDIKCQDYLTYEINPKYKNVLVVGNPPFGIKHKLSDSFIRHSLSFINVSTIGFVLPNTCLLYTSPSPRDRQKSRMPSSA